PQLPSVLTKLPARFSLGTANQPRKAGRVTEGSPDMNVSGSGAAGVPLFDVKQQYKGLQKQFEEAVNKVLQSGQFILWPGVRSLEDEVAHYCGAARAVACASGTDAISLALVALGIGPGDEVITPPFSFFATTACISRLGATPVFADIDPATYNI